MKKHSASERWSTYIMKSTNKILCMSYIKSERADKQVVGPIGDSLFVARGVRQRMTRHPVSALLRGGLSAHHHVRRKNIRSPWLGASRTGRPGWSGGAVRRGQVDLAGALVLQWAGGGQVGLGEGVVELLMGVRTSVHVMISLVDGQFSCR